jgi:hypothetical protein
MIPRRRPCNVPVVWLIDCTPDGFAEVVLEVSGRILATEVVDCAGDCVGMQERLREVLLRQC